MARTLHKTRPAQRPPAQIRIARGPAEIAFSRAGVTYQLERVNCGKRRCTRCRRGPSHGPYWYAYFWSRGRTASKYIGKKLPPGLVERDQAGAERDET